MFNKLDGRRVFVDSTIDLPRRNFLSPELGTVSEGSTLIVEIG